LNPDVPVGERIGKMFHPFGKTEGGILNFLGTAVSYKPKKKWWHVGLNIQGRLQFNYKM
jgi:hypothetical protein